MVQTRLEILEVELLATAVQLYGGESGDKKRMKTRKITIRINSDVTGVEGIPLLKLLQFSPSTPLHATTLNWMVYIIPLVTVTLISSLCGIRMSPTSQ